MNLSIVHATETFAKFTNKGVDIRNTVFYAVSPVSTRTKAKRHPGTRRLRYDVERLLTDMALRGWNASALSRASGVNVGTVSRFLDGSTQTAPTADKLARALGYTPKRYFLAVEAA